MSTLCFSFRKEKFHLCIIECTVDALMNNKITLWSMYPGFDAIGFTL